MADLLTEEQWKDLIVYGQDPVLTANQWEQVSGWELYGIRFMDDILNKAIHVANRALGLGALAWQLHRTARASNRIQRFIGTAKEKVAAAAQSTKGKIVEVMSKIKPGSAMIAKKVQHHVGDIVKPLVQEWDHTQNLIKNLDQIARKIQLRDESWTKQQLMDALDYAAKEMGYSRFTKQHPLFKPYPKYVPMSEVMTVDDFKYKMENKLPLKHVLDPNTEIIS